MTKEIWKPIIETDGQYEISSFGRIKKLFHRRGGKKYPCNPHKIFEGTNSRGYVATNIRYNGKASPQMVHRLIAAAFIPNPKNLPFINHIDGVKSNNSISNLEWCTQKENNHHATRIGLVPRPKGKDVWCSKLTEEQVLEIFNSNESGLVLAAKYGVRHSTIYGIKHKKKWKHLHL